MMVLGEWNREYRVSKDVPFSLSDVNQTTLLRFTAPVYRYLTCALGLRPWFFVSGFFYRDSGSLSASRQMPINYLAAHSSEGESAGNGGGSRPDGLPALSPKAWENIFPSNSIKKAFWLINQKLNGQGGV